MNALFVPFFYGFTAICHSILPARKVVGYACDCYTAEPLKYRLNGLTCLFVIAAIWLVLGYTGVINLSSIAENYYTNLMAANLLGLIGSLLLLALGMRLPPNKQQNYWRCPTRDRQKLQKSSTEEKSYFQRQSIVSKFYHGSQFNPRAGMFDLKMYLYLIGAVMLWLNVFSNILKASEEVGYFTYASLLYGWLFNHFLVEYLYFEEIHLYTYDLFAEKVGFKLLWGCFVFYPFFYCIGSRYLVLSNIGADMSLESCVLVALLFYSGWILTRGSNLQKFYFKQDPTQKYCFNGVIEQRTIPGTKIIVSGFWGAARHINYLGEIIQSVAISIPCWYLSGSFVPFLYPVYYILLFVPRQIDDDVICSNKYGDKWKLYQGEVPYRMVPFVW